MFKRIEAIHQLNRSATAEELAKLLQAETKPTIRECREWVKAWVMKG